MTPVIAEEGETDRQTLKCNRPDFWATTSNKQLEFVQHVKSLLTVHGRAAVVGPDNVLFEGRAGGTVRSHPWPSHDVGCNTVLSEILRHPRGSR